MTTYKLLPSDITEDMLEVLRPFLGLLDDELIGVLYKRVWQAAPKVEQEPVAYRNWNSGEGGYDYPWLYVDADDLEGHSDNYIRNAEPLYTHPQPKREALSDEDANALVNL